MKTLYERLEPSVLEGLKANQHEYEHSVGVIEDALKASVTRVWVTHLISDLVYLTVKPVR